MKNLLVYSLSIFLLASSHNTRAQSAEMMENFNTYRSFIFEEHFEEALITCQKTLLLCEKEFGKEHQYYGVIQSDLGDIYKNIGQYDMALPLYLMALENTEKSLGKEHSSFGNRLNNLAGLYKSMGQYEKALPLFLEALENTEKSLGKEHWAYGTRLNNLAGLYENMGEYDKALPLYLEALENTEKSLGKGHSEYGTSLNNLAGLYESMGQYDKALPLYLEALENTEKSLGKEHSAYGTRLNNLAVLCESMGQYDKALPLYLEALENTEKSLGKEHSAYGTRLNNLAVLYKIMGQYDKALPLFLESLENTEKSRGKKHSNYGIQLNNLAGLYESMGQYDKALPLYMEALENTEISLGKEHSEYGTRLNNLAELYQSMGQYDKALPLFLEAWQNMKAQVAQGFSFMSEAEKASLVKTMDDNFKAYQSFLLRYFFSKPTVSTFSYDIELVTKGMILNSGMAMQQAILGSGNAKALAQFEEWTTVKTMLATEYSKPIADRRLDLKELEARAEKLEADLNRVSSAFGSAQKIGSITWQDVQQQLKPNQVAIEFASFRYRNNKEWTDSIVYIALVLRPGDTYPQLVPLCEQKQLDSLFTKGGASEAGFVTNLYRGAEDANEDLEITYGQRLYELIWKPLTPYLKPGEHIFFTPSGTLHQIAFAALPIGNDSVLSEIYYLHQLSTTAKLVEQPKFQDQKPTEIALYGGINYEQSNAANTQSLTVSLALPSDLEREGFWPDLPGTLTEVMAIEKLAINNSIKTISYTGKVATELQYKSMAGRQSPRVLHISTHGFFFPEPKITHQDLQLSDSLNQVFRASDNPLQRAGIVLAGANQAWQGATVPEGAEDGILTAYEAANVFLNNTQLVTLSACETGLGDIKGSEGVFGLQRAFKAAGAEYLLMSLWKVPDTETAEFMTQFYQTWFSGVDISESFHKTQEYMKSKYPRDPYKWAAFVLVR